ncbi:MAG TPA: sensor domain-containing diguanylate cyclase [Candidatus Limnocylindrales bacterium]|jgi:diguanylate cyclase (GGDEF)-like protein|nr:sensor domain-containing diguanylate cyclase [Candidatus Limnocylindrales bacterium]
MSARVRSRDHAASPRRARGSGAARPALFRRLLDDPSGTASRAARPDAYQGLETELAERLDSVLGIAERLAATHDRPEVFRTIVDETRRALRVDYVTIRLLNDDHLAIAASAGLPEDIASALPVFRVGEGWVGEVLQTGRVSAWRDVRADRRYGFERYVGILDFAGDLIAPLTHHDRVIGALSAMTLEPRDWTDGDVAFVTTLATHAAIALTNAELFEQTEARAAQLAVLQAASGRLNRATSFEAVGRAVVEETRRIIDYHNARVYLVEPPDAVVPIAFEGRVGAYERVDFELLRCRMGEGFTGWVAQHGEPLLINDANSDPRGQTIAGTDDIDESMLVVPMRYDGITVGVITLSKLGLDGFEADDLRLLGILADHAATAVETARLLTRSQELTRELRRLLDMSGELSESLDPRQVANLMAGHLARAMGVDECAISYWDKPSGRVESLGYYPQQKLDELEPYFDVAGFPETLRVLERGVTTIIDADDPGADPAETALLRKDGNRILVMLPLVAKGQAIGLVELFSKTEVRWDAQHLELARTMSNEAAMALENARLYEDARKRADRDPLTGFFNHRYLHERMGEEVVRSQRGKRPLSVLMLDLDDFKLVNDTFGHLFGDKVLTWAAELIRGTLRLSDVPARYGGDEFAVILPDTDATEARRAAERILDGFRDRPYVDEQRGPVPIAASIGIATYPGDGRNATELIASADRALYRVKRDGGHGAAVGPDGAAA